MAEKMLRKYEALIHEVEHKIEAFEGMAGELENLIALKADVTRIRHQLNKISQPIIDIAIMRQVIEEADDHIANRMVELKKLFHNEITYN